MQEDKVEIEPEYLEVATLGGGCFWCTEAVFKAVNGVVKVEPGYSGGHMSYPTYEQVSTGKTGHAEVVQIFFNPKVISFEEILRLFFTVHDPTTVNRQGADVGSQYRSVVLYRDQKQKATSEKLINELNKLKIYDSPIVTELKQFKAFYKAENYHKDYFAKNLDKPYCKLVITPKITKIQKEFRDKLKLGRSGF